MGSASRLLWRACCPAAGTDVAGGTTVHASGGGGPRRAGGGGGELLRSLSRPALRGIRYVGGGGGEPAMLSLPVGLGPEPELAGSEITRKSCYAEPLLCLQLLSTSSMLLGWLK